MSTPATVAVVPADAGLLQVDVPAGEARPRRRGTTTPSAPRPAGRNLSTPGPCQVPAGSRYAQRRPTRRTASSRMPRPSAATSIDHRASRGPPTAAARARRRETTRPAAPRPSRPRRTLRCRISCARARTARQYERARIAIRSGSSSESGTEPSARIRQRTVTPCRSPRPRPSTPTADHGTRAQPVGRRLDRLAERRHLDGARLAEGQRLVVAAPAGRPRARRSPRRPRRPAATGVFEPSIRRTSTTLPAARSRGPTSIRTGIALELGVDGPAAERGVDPVVEARPGRPASRSSSRSLAAASQHARRRP